MDFSVWIIIGFLLLRFVLPLIQRAARESGKAPDRRPSTARPAATQPGATRPAAPAPPWGQARERAQRTRQRRDVAPRETAPQAEPSPQDVLLERLRQAVEAAAGVSPEPPPPPTPAPRFEPETAAYENVAAPPPRERPELAPAIPPALEQGATKPAPLRTPTRLLDMRAMLHDRATVRDALLLREILGPPVARRRGTPKPHSR